MVKKVVGYVVLGILVLGLIGGAYFINRFNKTFFGTPTSYAKFDYEELRLPFIYSLLSHILCFSEKT